MVLNSRDRIPATQSLISIQKCLPFKRILKNVRDKVHGNQGVIGLRFMKGSLVKELGKIAKGSFVSQSPLGQIKELRNLRSSNTYSREVSSNGLL